MEALLLSPLHCPEEQSGANVPTLNRWEHIERFEFGGKTFGPRVGLFHVCNAEIRFSASATKMAADEGKSCRCCLVPAAWVS